MCFFCEILPCFFVLSGVSGVLYFSLSHQFRDYADFFSGLNCEDCNEAITVLE
jgi:hypothetical protein